MTVVWPPLPGVYESMHGPVPVRLAPAPLYAPEGGTVGGYYDPAVREIVVARSPNPLNEWFIYYHECAHVELLDHSVLLVEDGDRDPQNIEERTCDAIANGRVRELRASLLAAQAQTTGKQRRRKA